MGLCVLILFTAFTVFISLLVVVTGHGMLIDPPGRSTAWRFGFDTPINYNDNELFCGGFVTQWLVNDGKCGICGDAYDSERIHELPNGKFAKDLVVTRKYIRGTIFTATVQLTANHRGHFVFKLCPATTRQDEVTQECLDSNVLEVVNSKDKFRYDLPSEKPHNFSVDLRLPHDLVCERCVLQWNYIAGNNWGVCSNGSATMGCGHQETFRNCADIEITPHENDVDGTISNNIPDNSFGSTYKPEGGVRIPTTSTQKSNDKKPTIRSILTSTLCPRMTTDRRKIFKDKSTTLWPFLRPKSRNMTTTPRPTFKPIELTKTSQKYTPKQATYSTTEINSISTATPISTNNSNPGKKCVAIGDFGKIPEMVSWCEVMCKNKVCPESHCHCF